MKRFVFVLVVLTLAGCVQAPPPTPVAKLKDGELAVPAGYKTWPSTLLNVQRADAKQIRDIYVNSIGASSKAGGKFDNGTVSVMEIYAAQAGADGALIKGADGNLVKGNLLKVFVMGKGDRWGDSAPAGLKNGDWIYSSFMPDGKTTAPDPIAACRTCHLTNAAIGESKDFFARYDEYFAKRK